MTGLAFALCVAWLLWTARVYWRTRPARSPARTKGLPPILVAYASQTGTAKQMAQAQQQALGGSQQAALACLSELRPQQLAQVEKAVFVVSTYGDGEPPDNGRRFYQDLLDFNTGNRTLAQLRYEVIALGDRSYPKFCQFGADLYQQLARLGAQADAALQTTEHGQTPAQPAAYTRKRWQLTARERLNTAADAGLFRLCLQPVDAMPSWRAGDLVAVHPGGDTAPRKYSIASAPGERMLQLIVRQHITERGVLGLCSGWLTRNADLGTEVTLDVLANPGCHIDAHQQPLLLIGAGSGLAGLRGHLAERAQQKKGGPTWLIYGERSMDPSQGLLRELEHWQKSGVLKRLDYACSRDLQQPAYVQDLVQQQAAQIRDFIGRKGHIYLCGRYEGMGTAVDAALCQVLGASRYADCVNQGRLHRDLY